MVCLSLRVGHLRETYHRWVIRKTTIYIVSAPSQGVEFPGHETCTAVTTSGFTTSMRLCVILWY
jgi:hypothetical protein